MAARKGSKHHAATLTEAIVRDARKKFKAGGYVIVDGKREEVTYASLGRKYGVGSNAIRYALQGKTWRHVS